MIGTSKTREHRVRELLNLITLATRCSNLPGLDEAQRRQWRDEARRALEEIHDLWPHRSTWDDELPCELKQAHDQAVARPLECPPRDDNRGNDGPRLG